MSGLKRSERAPVISTACRGESLVQHKKVVQRGSDGFSRQDWNGIPTLNNSPDREGKLEGVFK